MEALALLVTVAAAVGLALYARAAEPLERHPYMKAMDVLRRGR